MTSDHAGPRFQRPAPPEYLDKYAALPISSTTAQLYAMLEYVDSQVGRGRARQNTAAAAALATVFADVARRRFWCVQQPQLACCARPRGRLTIGGMFVYAATQVGRLLAWLDASGLASNTYVMLSGDNGPALFGSEQGHLPKEVWQQRKRRVRLPNRLHQCRYSCCCWQLHKPVVCCHILSPYGCDSASHHLNFKYKTLPLLSVHPQPCSSAAALLQVRMPSGMAGSKHEVKEVSGAHPTLGQHSRSHHTL